MFITGVAGTGKFFLIETIKSAVAKVWPSTDLTCAVLAPTGLAAFNVGGPHYPQTVSITYRT